MEQKATLLSIREAAEYLGVSKSTLRIKLNNGQWKIPSVEFGTDSLRRFDVRDLDRFIDRYKVSA
jgi:excisionase family DNA binding protein